MNVLKSGNSSYKIIGDGLNTLKELPVGTYSVSFDPMQGYSLDIVANISVSEKIYGSPIQKVEKIFSAFMDKEGMTRNLGVILSGAKGTGKSVTSKLLAMKAIESGMPVLVINHAYPNLAEFINSIEQECLVLLDEFDKTFSGGGENVGAQTELLTLLDGFFMGRKMYILTCNDLGKINNYIVNRPGRCHYHLRFGFPTPVEVTEYMQDHLKEEYWDRISDVVNFSAQVDVTYDCLRAIAYEMNRGYTFAEAISDLNILNVNTPIYKVTLFTENGLEFRNEYATLNMFSDTPEKIWVKPKNEEDSDFESICIEFTPSDAEWRQDFGNSIFGTNVKITDIQEEEYRYYLSDNSSDEEKLKVENLISQMKSDKPKLLIFKRLNNQRSLHYAL